MVEIRYIDSSCKQDVSLRNDPFTLWGRLIPSYENQQWGWTIERFSDDDTTEMCFPDAGYDYDRMSENTVFIGAYEGNQCIGLAVLEKSWHRYLYLSDLNVLRGHRKKGVGKMLIQAALKTAKEQNYYGVSLYAQDNNLTACLFYLNCGFRIGGFDTEIYNGTSQAGKADVHFYFDL